MTQPTNHAQEAARKTCDFFLGLNEVYPEVQEIIQQAIDSALAARGEDTALIDWYEANPEAIKVEPVRKSWGRKIWWVSGSGDYHTLREAIASTRDHEAHRNGNPS